MQTRFYDPTVRRFLNADSLFIAGDEVTGANMYAYCNGNPVMMWDPTGEDAIVLYQQRIGGALFGDISLLVQNANGEWYFFMFALNNVFFVKLDSKDGVLKSNTFSKLNDEIQKKTGYRPAFKDSVYLTGNYTKAFNYCLERRLEYQRDPGMKLPFNKGFLNKRYSLTYMNCSRVAMLALSMSNNDIYIEFFGNPLNKNPDITNPTFPKPTFDMLKSMYRKGIGKLSV